MVNIKEVRKVRSLNERLFNVLLGWLALVVLVSLLSFFYGMMYAEAGYNLPFSQFSTLTLYSLSLVVVIPIGFAWWQVRQTRQLVSLLNPSKASGFKGAIT